MTCEIERHERRIAELYNLLTRPRHATLDHLVKLRAEIAAFEHAHFGRPPVIECQVIDFDAARARLQRGAILIDAASPTLRT